MHIILTGINYKSSPIDVREQMSFDSDSATKALGELTTAFPGSEFVLLSTCNRVECYAAVSKTSGPEPLEIAQRLAAFRGLPFAPMERYFYLKTNEDAVSHLFTVTASLDSMVVGESQITAQVKESYRIACDAETTGKVLNRLFHQAFRTAKDIISSTSICSRRVSVAGVAIGLAKKLFGEIARARTLVVGAGQMGELLVEHLLHEKCAAITVINRCPQHAGRLAAAYNVCCKSWETLDQEMAQCDILVSAASTQQGHLFSKERIESLMARRQDSLLIIDIAVPRSFDPEIGEIENVHLYSVDDLAHAAQENLKLREGDLEAAVDILCSSVSSFMKWFRMRDVGPIIGQIKSTFEQIRQLELEHMLSRRLLESCPLGQTQDYVPEAINKVCHVLIRNIDSLSIKRGPEEAEKAARTLLADATKILSEHRRNQ